MRAVQHPQIYNSWRGMHDRCRRLNRADAHCYAAKGIRVCGQWSDYPTFERWALENGWKPGLTIERTDGTKPYEPGNCIWADRLTQGRNLSKNHRITIDGVTRCLSEWCEITGVHSSLVLGRINRLGWSEREAVLTPVGAIKRGPKARRAA